MNLEKSKLESILKGMGFTATSENTYVMMFNERRYLVDFKHDQVCRTDGQYYDKRVESDKDDEFLTSLHCIVAKAMGTTEEKEVESPSNENEKFADYSDEEDSNCTIGSDNDKVIDVTPNTPAVVQQRYVVQQPTEFTPSQVHTIKNTVAKGATDDELAMFLHISQAYGLDPFLKEIFYSSQMKTIITSRDGYLKVAQRDPEFDGIQSMAVCENDDFAIDMVNNVVNHSFGKGTRGEVIGAWAVCYRKGRRPVIAYADYDEYNKNNQIWKTYKSAMCCKVAEVFALKRQFGISGLVTQEEMGVEA